MSFFIKDEDLEPIYLKKDMFPVVISTVNKIICPFKIAAYKA
jgi:hypothetical protein